MDGNNERLLTPGEVAALFRVDPKTVTRWAASGRTPASARQAGTDDSVNPRCARCCVATVNLQQKGTRWPDAAGSSPGAPRSQAARLFPGSRLSRVPS